MEDKWLLMAALLRQELADINLFYSAKAFWEL